MPSTPRWPPSPCNVWSSRPSPVLAAPWGPGTGHSVPRKYLTYGFGVLLVATLIKMFWSLRAI